MKSRKPFSAMLGPVGTLFDMGVTCRGMIARDVWKETGSVEWIAKNEILRAGGSIAMTPFSLKT